MLLWVVMYFMDGHFLVSLLQNYCTSFKLAKSYFTLVISKIYCDFLCSLPREVLFVDYFVFLVKLLSSFYLTRYIFDYTLFIDKQPK